MTNQEYMTIVNKVAFEADKAKPKMEPYKDDYNMGVYVGLLKAVNILRASYNSVKTELKSCEDWKFYYQQGYAQVKRDLEWTRNEVLDKIRAELKDWQTDIHDNEHDAETHDFVFERLYEIIDEYRTESEE